MPNKPIFIALFLITALYGVLILPSYAVIQLTIGPPATSGWSAYSPGTTRTITDVNPGDFKENNQENIGFGTFSNRVFVGSNQNGYVLKIKCSDLIGPATIPASALQYIYTYSGNISFTHEATGTKLNYRKYVPFSNGDQIVYQNGASGDEVPSFPTYTEWEHQFKYAIKVPHNTPFGTYNGTITYDLDETGGGSYTGTANISVTVNTVFSMTVDRGTIDFAKMSPSETKDNIPPEGVIVTSKTNTGNPLFLKIYNTSPLSSGAYMIPNTNFIWYGWTEGMGTWYGNGTDQMNFAPALMYASGAGERYQTKGILNHLKFKLTIPRGQPAGKYITSVVVTQTE